jgi:hypothetical protein
VSVVAWRHTQCVRGLRLVAMAAFSAGTLAFAWPVSVGHSARAADVSFKLVNGVCGSGQVIVGQGCWDQQVSFFKQNWSVNDGTAT